MPVQQLRPPPTGNGFTAESVKCVNVSCTPRLAVSTPHPFDRTAQTFTATIFGCFLRRISGTKWQPTNTKRRQNFAERAMEPPSTTPVLNTRGRNECFRRTGATDTIRSDQIRSTQTVTSSCRMQVMTTGPVLFLNNASPSLYDPNGTPSSLYRTSPDSIPAA